MDATVVRSLVGSTLKVKWPSLVGFIASSILWLSLFAHPQNKTASELLTSAGNWLGLPERWGTDITLWFEQRADVLNPLAFDAFIILLLLVAGRVPYRNERASIASTAFAALYVLTGGQGHIIAILLCGRVMLHAGLTWLYLEHPGPWGDRHPADIENVVHFCLTPFIAAPVIALGFILNDSPDPQVRVRITDPISVRRKDSTRPRGAVNDFPPSLH